MIAEQTEMKANPFHFLKWQGQGCPEFPFLWSEDFVLVLVTGVQLKKLQEFGNDVVCIDSTHNTNRYRFLLYTLLVRDDHGKCCPVAHLITTRAESSESVRLFYEVMRSLLPTPFKWSPKWLMSSSQLSFLANPYPENKPKTRAPTDFFASCFRCTTVNV